MDILFQLILRFDPPNLKVKATVPLVFCIVFLFLFLIFFEFLFGFSPFTNFFCPPSGPLTRLARPPFGKRTGKFSQVFLKR